MITSKIAPTSTTMSHSSSFLRSLVLKIVACSNSGSCCNIKQARISSQWKTPSWVPITTSFFVLFTFSLLIVFVVKRRCVLLDVCIKFGLIISVRLKCRRYASLLLPRKLRELIDWNCLISNDLNINLVFIDCCNLCLILRFFEKLNSCACFAGCLLFTIFSVIFDSLYIFHTGATEVSFISRLK